MRVKERFYENKMRILLTNDDGISAKGIFAAKLALDSLGEVFLVAPERPRSAAGHAITLHKPLRATPTTLPDGSKGWATNGTPTDCVTLGFDILMEGRCDLVVSGINHGSNLGWDLTYSGTVAGALEGAILNIPAIAISLTIGHGASGDFQPAADFLAKLASKIYADPIPQNMLLNVNVPSVSESEIRGVSMTHQGKREYIDRFTVCQDPGGKTYYWQSGRLKEDAPDIGSDVHAISENRISVTPIQLDMTAYSVLDQVRNWSF